MKKINIKFIWLFFATLTGFIGGFQSWYDYPINSYSQDITLGAIFHGLIFAFVSGPALLISLMFNESLTSNIWINTSGFIYFSPLLCVFIQKDVWK